METIAIDDGAWHDGVIRNPRPDLSVGLWAEGMWCGSTLGPEINILVGWDGLIRRAWNGADDSEAGYWKSAS